MAFCTYSCDLESPEPNEWRSQRFGNAPLREGDVVEVLASYKEPLLPRIVEANIAHKTKKDAERQRSSIHRAHEKEKVPKDPQCSVPTLRSLEHWGTLQKMVLSTPLYIYLRPSQTQKGCLLMTSARLLRWFNTFIFPSTPHPSTIPHSPICIQHRHGEGRIYSI